MEDVLAGLNEEQREAVTETEGCIRVVAGAGSGKTRALTHRFAYLVNELGIRPGNILCVTFTNKAAAEMRQRIHALTGDNDTGFINTFHGFCVSVLQEDSHAVQYPKSFLVLDNADIDAMLKIIYEERGLTLKDMTFSDARDYFEMRKGVYEREYYLHLTRMSVQDLYRMYMDATQVKDILFYGYLYQQKKCFGLDYNDLIFLTLYIFRENEEIRLKWQKRLEYIMIDEFQDIDEPQYELMKVLCQYHHNLFIVGDPDQTIYTWRGANQKFLLDFSENFPDVKTIMLTKNYRSTPQIIACVNSLINANKTRIKKELSAVSADGLPVRYHHAATAGSEADWIADEIEKLKAEGVDYREIAILYRAHYVTRPIEDAFVDRHLPYVIYSGVPFYGRMEIKDAVCYLRMIAYQDDLSFLRIVNVPKRNIGKRRIAFLQNYAREHGCTLYESLLRTCEDEIFSGTKAKSFIDLVEKFRRSYGDQQISEVLTQILEDSGYETMLRTEGSQERLDNLAELKQSIYEYETQAGEEVDLPAYLCHIALLNNGDLADAPDKVKMMTIHAAKGLEFPYVFLCGLNEGILPSRKTKSQDAMEEERRLAFVAMTRAREGLFLSDAEGKNFDRSTRYVSRFVLDIDPELITYDVPLQESLVKQSREYISHAQGGLTGDPSALPFGAGDRVVHPVFGEGTVLEISEKEEAIFIKFDRLASRRGIALKAAGKLKPLTPLDPAKMN